MAVSSPITTGEAVAGAGVAVGDSGLRLISLGIRKGSLHTMEKWGENVLGVSLALGLGYVMNAFIGYRDYKFEQERLRGFYEAEVAAQLGKSPDSVRINDLKIVAQKNPMLAAALKRNKAHRLLEFGVNSASFTAGFFVTTAALTMMFGPAAGFTLGTFLVGAAIGLTVFMPCEKLLEHAGRRLFGLHEPRLSQLSRNPALQKELSGPSQVRFLAQLQGRVNPRHPETFIRPEQVMTAFLAINPELDTAITKRYGVPFADLRSETQQAVMQEMGESLGIYQLTADLNSRTVRAQEVAFAAFGKSSGVPKLDSPRVSALQQSLDHARGKLAAAEQTIGELTHKAKEKTVQTAGAVGGKVKQCFYKSKVDGVVPANQNMANAAMIPMEGKIPVGNVSSRILAQRQQPALNQTATLGA